VPQALRDTWPLTGHVLGLLTAAEDTAPAEPTPA
jgi:hypothetical protein